MIGGKTSDRGAERGSQYRQDGLYPAPCLVIRRNQSIRAIKEVAHGRSRNINWYCACSEKRRFH